MYLNSFTSIPNQRNTSFRKMFQYAGFSYCTPVFRVLHRWMLLIPSINNWLLIWWGIWYLGPIIFNKTKTFPLDFKISIVVPFGFVGKNLYGINPEDSLFTHVSSQQYQSNCSSNLHTLPPLTETKLCLWSIKVFVGSCLSPVFTAHLKSWNSAFLDC